jgi:F-type H+-transporting ATPase subunit delta
MAEPLTIARPYAEAAFQLAVDDAQHQGASQLAVWSEGLQSLVAVIRAPGAEALIDNPGLSAGQIAQAVIEISGIGVGPLQGFVQVLAANERLSVVAEIAQLFEQARGAHEGVIDARVTSAFPMNDAQVAEVVAVLTQRHGRPVKVSVDVDADLIGGVSIRIGDEVTDLSVRGKLSQLAGALMH